MDDLVIEIDDDLLGELTRLADRRDVGELAGRMIVEALGERRD